MKINAIRRRQTVRELKNYLFAYLSTIGLEPFSDFYGTESDPTSYTIRFKHYKKMQVVLSNDPGKSKRLTFSLYLFDDEVNYEYITFSFCNRSIYPLGYVIQKELQEYQYALEQSIYFTTVPKLLSYRFSYDFQKNFYPNSLNDLEVLKRNLPQADHVSCRTTSVIDNLILKSYFGPEVTALILCKGGIIYG